MPKRIDVKLKLRSSQRVVDENNRIIMAEGRMALLDAIAATGSINQAAKSMGMAYKSAWSKIRSTEAHLNTKIVHSDKSQGTRLTKAGYDLLNKYRALKQQSRAADDAIFNALFHPDDHPGPSFAMPERPLPPILSFVGHSGCGKTTFIEKLIPLIAQADVKVAIIKHDVHGFEMDKPGKDTWRHKRAGAFATLISNAAQLGMVMDVQHDHQPLELAPLLHGADLILTEGFKRAAHPKIEVFRPAATNDRDLLCRNDPQLVAVISDDPVSIDAACFSFGHIQAVADFIFAYFRLKS